MEKYNYVAKWWYCSGEAGREIKAKDGMACITKEVGEFAQYKLNILVFTSSEHVVGFFGLPWLCSRFRGKLIEDESKDCMRG